jgi:hypothetical protein
MQICTCIAIPCANRNYEQHKGFWFLLICNSGVLLVPCMHYIPLAWNFLHCLNLSG